MEPIRVRCPNCGKHFDIPQGDGNANGRCTRCQVPFSFAENVASNQPGSVSGDDPTNTLIATTHKPMIPDSRAIRIVIMASLLCVAVLLYRRFHHPNDAPHTQQTVTAPRIDGEVTASTPIERTASDAGPSVDTIIEEHSNKLLAELRKVFDGIAGLHLSQTGNNQLMEKERVDAIQKAQALFGESNNKLIAASFPARKWRVFVLFVRMEEGAAQVEVLLRSVNSGGKTAMLTGVFIDEDGKCTDVLKRLRTSELATVSGTFSSHKDGGTEFGRDGAIYRIYFKLDDVQQ